MFERIPVSRAVLEAHKAFNMREIQKAFDDNRERLKSERLG
jgi:hypothetical protein